MDMLLFLWALAATVLFILEKRSHDTTRYEYIEYRTKAELNMIIDNQVVRNIKSVRLPSE